MEATESNPQSFSPRDAAGDSAGADAKQSRRAAGLSYKFQRLRERLREAVRSGEFEGKLPGERQLAKRFHVNAKTLSKALTDLAAEGLLDRSIGRGTFVKGSAPPPAAQGRWLALCGSGGPDAGLAQELRQANPEIAFCSDLGQMRPSFLTPFSAVLDLGAGAPDSLMRDLVVRNLPLVAVGHEPRTFAMHCVMPDVAMGGQKLARDLMLAGHRRLVAVEPAGQSVLTHALRQAASRYAPDATIDTCTAQEVATLLGDGAVAFVCDSAQAARIVRAVVAENATADVAIVAVGVAGESEAPCSGYFVESRQVVDSINGLLREPPARPTAIWLTGQFLERGTMCPASSAAPVERSAAERKMPQFAGMAS